MRRTLNDTKRTNRVTLELSNSSGKFWERLGRSNIHQGNYKERPFEVARTLIEQENEWHESVGLENGGPVDLSKSFYPALSWNTKNEYQLFKFSLSLPEPGFLSWDFPANDDGKTGRRLRGRDDAGTLMEWYGESGGQLKYYPTVDSALWKSHIFNLEPLPKGWEKKHGILAKAKDYFPRLWETL